jgi:uncharacterized membrane protein
MSRRARGFVWTAFVAFAAATGTASLLRYASFHSRSLDMAYYIRLVWGLGHGHLDNPVVGADCLLGLHLEPILVPLAALGRLLPIPEMLLVVQALGAAAAIFPAHALARRHLPPRAAAAAALTIFLMPTVSRCIDYDFHPVTIAIWPLLAVAEAVDARAWRRAALWAAFALTFREDIGLQIACVAAPSLFERSHRRPAAALVAAGVLWFAGYALLVQPRWLPDPTTGSFGAHFARFGGGAGGVGGVLASALADPGALARYLVSGDRLAYLPLLLLPVAFLPLAAPRLLLGALPIFLVNLLSDFPRVRTLQAHYATAMAPFIVAAAIVGAGRLRRAVPLLVAAATVAWWLRGLSPGSPEFSPANYRDDDAARRARAVVATVPPEASVTAPPRVLAHLAERLVVVAPGFERGPLDVVITEEDLR